MTGGVTIPAAEPAKDVIAKLMAAEKASEEAPATPAAASA